MGIRSRNTTRPLLSCSAKARRKSIAIAVDQTVKARNSADNFLFEPLEPRILLSADGVMPIAPEVDLLDVVSDSESVDASLATISEPLSNQIPNAETGSLTPESNQESSQQDPSSSETENQQRSSNSENTNNSNEQSVPSDVGVGNGESVDDVLEASSTDDLINADPAASLELDQNDSSQNSLDQSSTTETEPEVSESIETVLEENEERTPERASSESEDEQDTLVPANAVLQILEDSNEVDTQIIFVDLSIDGYEDLITGINTGGSDVLFVDPPEGFDQGEFFATQAEQSASANSLALDDAGQVLDTEAENRSSDQQSQAGQIVVYFIDSNENGVQKITDSLAAHEEVDAVHILSHGAAGAVNLGNTRLSNDNVSKYRNDLMAWGGTLGKGADILFYGCDVGSTSHGMELLEDVAELTGADVSASDDDTGNAEFGGDYDLEVSVGDVQVEALFAIGAELQFSGVLADLPLDYTITGTTGITISSDGTDITIVDGASTVVTPIVSNMGMDTITSINITGVDGQADNVILDFTDESLLDFTITFDGGTGSGDSLTINGGGFSDVTYTASGTVNITDDGAMPVSSAITFSNVDSISDSSSADNRVFEGLATADDITVQNGAAAGQTTIQSANSADITFDNPADSLTINTGDGDDVIAVTADQLTPTNGIAINAGAGSDSLSLDLTNGLIDIDFDGGTTAAGDNDSLAITNGSYEAVVYSASADANSGDVEFFATSGGAVTDAVSYSNVDSISDASTADDRSFIGSDNADQITLVDGAVAGQSQIQDTAAAGSSTFVDINFNNPTNSLSIESGQGDDVITIAANQDAAFAPTNGLNIDAGTGSDTVSIDLASGLIDADFDGGTTAAGDNDSLAITNGTYDSVVYSNGQVEFSTGAVTDTLTYTNFDVISDDIAATARTFIGTAGADQITLTDADGATDGQSQIQSTTSADVTFNNPATSLTIQAGEGDDDIIIDADQDATLNPSAGIMVEGGEGADTLSVDLSTDFLVDIEFDGGTNMMGAESDAIAITNGTFSSVVYSADNVSAASGSVEFFDEANTAQSNTITYSNLESVSDDSDAVGRTFIATNAVDEITIVDADIATVGQTRIQDDATIKTFADITFKGPSEFLKIESGDGADTINLETGQDAGLSPERATGATQQNSGILIDGGTGSDTITVDGDADFIVNIINGEALTINGTVLDESSEIAGLDALITFLQSLESNGAFGVDFPLSGSTTPGSASFGSVSGVTEVLQQLRDDIAADTTARGDLDAFLATWTAVVTSAQGDITISTANVTDTVVTVDDQEFEVSNSLEIDASRTTTVDVDNVEVLNEANVGFTPNPANPNYTVDIKSDLDFTFGTNQDGFYTEINTLNVNYADSATTPIQLDGSLQIGVLGADITGTALNLDADIALTFDDPNNDGAQISIAELNAANAMGGDRDALVNFEAQGEFALTLDFTPQDGFAPTLAGTIQVGGDGVLGNGNSYDIFSDYAQGAPVDLMSDDLRGISLLSAEELIEPLNDFALFLDRLTDSGLYDGNLLLTDGARIGDLLEYTELLRAEVIADVSNLVLDADRNIARNPDGTPVGDGSPTFATIQEFQALFNPSEVSFTYDSANNTLGIAVSLSEQRITEADFDYNIILESLEELEALSTAVDTSTTPTTTTATDLTVDVDTTLGLDFTFEFNLQAIDAPVLEPSNALASAQTGQLANDAQFELTVGGETRLVTVEASATSTNTSLADLIVDINQALDTSFTATVTVSLDESSGSEFPRLSFSSGAGAISVSDLSRIDTGVVTQDSSINLSINDSVTPANSQAQTISLLAADTLGNSSLSDLLVDINAAIDAEFGANVITAALDASGQRIELSLDGAPANQILNINNLNFLVEDQKVENPAIDVLGLTVGSVTSGSFGILNTLPDVDINAAGVDIEFALELDAVRTANFTVAATATAGLSSADELVALFNMEFAAIDVTAAVENGRLVFAADDGSGVTSLRIIAESDNPISTVLGFSSGQGDISKELAPAFFDTNETSIDATVRTSFSQTGTTVSVSGDITTTEGVTARYGFVDIDFTEVAAQSTMTLSTSLMDASDGQIDITQLNDPLGSIVDGPIVSGALSDTTDTTDPDYVANDNLRSLVTASVGDIQFAVYLDGYAAGESQTAEHRLTVSATLPFAFGESDLGLGDNTQSIVGGQLTNTILDTGTLTGVADFNLTIAGVDTLNVSVDTTSNTSSTDLISDINSAIDAEIMRLTEQAQDAGDTAKVLQLQGYDIQVNIIDGALVFQEANDLLLELLATNTVAENELNLTDANGTERLIFTDLFENPAIDTEGRPRADVELALQIDNNPAVTITLDQGDTSDNIDLIDLVTDINAALALTSLATTVEARVVASRLALVNLGPANTQLSVSAEPLSVEVEGDSRSTFISINDEIIKDALSNFADVLEQTDFAESDTGPTAFLDEILPIIGQSGLDLNDYITAFSTFVTEVNNLNVDSLQELERGINELMGLNHDVVNADAATGLTAAGINFDFTGTDSFGIDLVFQQEAETEFGFFIDAYGLASFVADGADMDNEPDIPSQIDDDRVVIRDPLNAVELVAESLASLNLQLDVDLSNSEVIVDEDTNVDLDIRVHEDDLDLAVKVGSASLFVQDGSIIIDGDGDISTDDYLTISTDFNEFILTDSPSVNVGVGGEFEVDLDGRADIQLPLFQNASNSSALPSAADATEDAEPINFQFDVADLIEETPGSVTINDPDNLPVLVDLVSSGLNNLLSDPSLLIDGLDNVLAAIQTALQLQLDALGAIPLIGEQIQDAIQPFFDDLNQARIDLNDFLLDEYAQAVTATEGGYVSLEDPSDPDSRVLLDLPLILREALYDLFAGSGDQGSAGITDGNNDGEGPRLGLLQDLASDGNANVGFEDILLNQFNDVENDDEGVQYDFHIGQSYSISLPFDIGLGFEDFLPGIGFNASSDEGVTVDVSWDLRLGFGISTQDLFYINTVHFEDISDAGSDYAEELQLAVDVSVPGLETEVGLGLVGATITDGVEANATISTTERIPVNFEGIEGGEFTLTLFSDVYNDDGTLRTIDTTGKEVTFDVDPKAGFSLSNPAGPLTTATALLADLNLQGFGDVLVIPDLSEIELLNPGYGLTFQALDPDVTRIEFEHIDGNNFGLGNVITEQGPAILVDSDGEIIRGPEGPVVDANGVPVLDDDGEPLRGRTGSIAMDADGNEIFDASGLNFLLIIGDPVFETIIVDIENQYEDSRATGLGFANGQTASGGVIVGEFEAPTAGVLNQDVLFTLMVSGQEVEVSVRANSLNDEVDNPDEDGIEDNGDETVDGIDAFIIQVQEALDLALGEAGLAEGLVEISTTVGSDTLTLAGAGLQSIKFSNDETSFASLKFAVDLFGDVPEPGEDTPFDPLYDFVETADGLINTFAAESDEAPNLDRPRLTLPELASSPQTSIYVTLDADAEVRLHVETNTNNIDAFIDNVAGIGGLGLPSIEFDFKAGAQGSLILFGQVDPDMPAEESKEFSFDDIDFDNIQVDLGGLINSFLGPALDGINTILGPVFDLVGDGAESTQGFLNAPIPIISDIAGLLGISDDFSFLDLTGNKTTFNAFFDAIEQISKLTDAIDAIADTGKVNLGGLRIVLDDESPFYFPKFGKPVPIAVANVYDNISTEESSLLQLLGITADGSPIPDPGGFKLDLLAPGNIFKLLTGDSFDIFSFNLPKLQLELGIDLGFDFDVLAFNIDGGVSVTVDLGIGYDSTGLERIKQAQDEGTAIDGADLLDGFFIRTIEGGGPEISFDANFSGGGSVDIHTPSFCIDLGFLGSACFPRFDIFVVQANLNADFSLELDIIDPNEDGKLRFNEILDVTNGFSNPENALFLFDIIAQGGGSFNINGTILGVPLDTSDLGLDSLSPRFSISAQDIFGGLGFNSPFVPVIAEVLTTTSGSTGIIRINAGEFAYDRIYGDTDDSHGANVSVRNINAGTLRFTDNTSGNFTDVSTAGISSIVFRGVDARDVLDASGVTSNISFDVRGNGGNDSLTTGSGSDVVLGGTGQDFIDGRNGSDSLFGERGSDDIRGGNNTDLIAGGQGNDVLQGQAGGDRYLFLTTADERNGFGQDTINESSAANTYADGRVLAISSVQQRGTNGIQVTSEGHGLTSGQTIIVTGVVGISNANGTVTVTRIDDNNFVLNGRNFVGGFDGSLGGGYIVDTNAGNLDPTRSPAFNLLTDTVDLTNANSSQSLLFDIGSDGSNNPRTTVSFVEEEVAVNTITHNGTGIETFLGGSGNDTFDLSHNTNFTNLDGIEGSDKYIVRLGDNLTGDINVQDTGIANATDSLFVFGRDDALIPDAVGLTNSEILFNAGTADEKSISYAPPAPGGGRLDSGLEVIQIDLLQGDDTINIESTPSESTVTINGGLGSDVFKVGVNASTGAEQNLNLIDGTEENGPLKLFGNDENPAVAENASDLDQLEIFDTTDTAGNNAANNNAGILGFNADTGIGKLEGLDITIAIEFGGVETVDLTLGLGADELLVLGAINTDGRATTGLTTINASTGKDKIDLSLSSGSVVTVNGEEDNDQITVLASADAEIIINGDEGDDEINVTALSALASVAVQGGIGRDTVNFGSTRSSADQGQGSVDGIDGMISVQGGADLDTLNIDDSGDTTGDNGDDPANDETGVITSSSITGLGMANGIGSYTDFEQVYVYTGSGADEVNIQSTDVDAVTLVDTNAGDDEIQVSSNSTLTGDLDSVQGDLAIHGGDGNNALLISDLATATADTNVVFGEGDFDPLRPYIVNDAFTANAGLQNHHFITGLAGLATMGTPYTTGTIYYSGTFNSATGDFRGQEDSKGGVTVFAGDQGNTFQIDSVYADNLTTLYTGDGNDTVTTAALSDTVNAASNPTADGELLIYGEDGTDIVDASLSDINVTLDGGNDDDILFAGNANDLIVGGDGADYVDGGNGDDVIFGDSAVTLDLDAQIITRTTNATGGNDFLIGSGGADEIHGELADDVIFGDNAASIADPASGEIISAISDPDAGLVLSNASSAQANGVVRITSSGGTAGMDQIFGDDGDDIIIGGLDEDTIQGNAGEDTIFGDNATAMFAADMGVSRPLNIESTDTDQGGNDTIFGDSYTEDPTLADLGLEDAQNDTDGASDLIFGGIGDDQINAQAGDDIVFGDNGIVHFNDATPEANDLLSTAEDDFGADTINSGVGDDVVIADHGDVTRDDMEEVTRVESTFLTGADDIVDTGDGDDIVIGGGGSDEIDSGAGNDIVLGDFGFTEGGRVETSDSSSGGMDTITDSSGNNIIAGGADSDNITTGGGNDVILGDSGTTNGSETESTDTGVGGSDTISTSGGNNQIIGGAQGDQITSGGGNDVIIGDSGSTNGSESESVDSGVGGSDTISTSGGNNQIIGGAQGDQITSGGGNDAIIGDSGSTNGSQTQSTDPSVGGSDTITTSGGNNQIIGGANGDNIQSGSGNDAILGDSGSTNGRNTESTAPTVGGNDNINTAGGNNQIIGGVGADNIQSGNGQDQVLGDNGSIDPSSTTSSSPSVGGNDDISTGGGNDQVVAGTGSDTVDAGGGNDAVLGDNGTTNGSVTQSTEPGTGGADTITSGSGNNQIIGGAAGDNITTGGGRDNILGDNGTATGSTVTSASPSVGGNDRISSGGGDDKIVAGVGSDDVNAGGGDDSVLGDNGRITENRLQTTQQTIGGDDSLEGGSGNDDILGGFGNDFIDGGSGDDILLGDNGSVTYSGNIIVAETEGRFIGGNDFIRGGAGFDVLIGGAGADILDGNFGEDILIADNGRVVLGINPDGSRFVISIDAVGTGPLDPFALQGLFNFDPDKADGLVFELPFDGVNTVDGSPESGSEVVDSEPRRIQHHNVPKDVVEEEEAAEEGQPLEENPEIDKLEIEATPSGVQPENETTLEQNQPAQAAENTTALNDEVDLTAYLGAASLALSGWTPRVKRQPKESLSSAAQEVQNNNDQRNNKRMAYDFEHSAFVSER